MAKNLPFADLENVMNLTNEERAELQKKREIENAWQEYTRRPRRQAK